VAMSEELPPSGAATDTLDEIVVRTPTLRRMRNWRRPVLSLIIRLLLSLVVVIVALTIWSSSPTVSLVLTREQAIARAAPDATLHGRLVWTHVDSKLITYREWNGLASFTLGLGYSDPTDGDALVWVVSYDGPMLSVGADSCEWTLLAFAADGRMPRDWRGSECGRGDRPSTFYMLVDRAWLRLDALRDR